MTRKTNNAFKAVAVAICSVGCSVLGGILGFTAANKLGLGADHIKMATISGSMVGHLLDLFVAHKMGARHGFSSGDPDTFECDVGVVPLLRCVGVGASYTIGLLINGFSANPNQVAGCVVAGVVTTAASLVEYAKGYQRGQNEALLRRRGSIAKCER